MWSKYYLALPAASYLEYPVCVYMPLSRDETTWGQQPTARSQEPGARAEQRVQKSQTRQSQGGLISSVRGRTVHSNDLTARCNTLGTGWRTHGIPGSENRTLPVAGPPCSAGNAQYST